MHPMNPGAMRHNKTVIRDSTAVISDASFDKGGWDSLMNLELTLVADMERMNRKFGPPSFGF